MFLNKILLKIEVHYFVFKLYHKGGGGGMSIITTDLWSLLRDCKGEVEACLPLCDHVSCFM